MNTHYRSDYWQLTAARDLLIVVLIGFLLCLLYLLRDIFIPLLIALVLAHVFNPLITWLEQVGLATATDGGAFAGSSNTRHDRGRQSISE
jgi:predicted PurR-regulated permease PerM